MPKINVLVISDDPANHTGFGRVVRSLFREFNTSDKVSVKAMALYANPSDEPRDVAIIKPTAGDEYGVASFLQYSMKNRVDIVFLLGDWWYWKTTLLNTEWRQAKQVVSKIWYYVPLDGVILEPNMKKALMAADKLIAMSPFGLTELSKLKPDVFYLPHGYDPAIYNPFCINRDNTRPFTFGVVARNARRKNIWAIIRAFSILVRSQRLINSPVPNLFIHTPTNDEIGGNLRAYAKYCEVEDLVEFSSELKIKGQNVEGFQDSELVHQVYSNIDCIVSAGREGFGLPFIEAAALGIPMVIPEYSAHASMNYPNCITYLVDFLKPDPSGVMDMHIDVEQLFLAMKTAHATYKEKRTGTCLIDKSLHWSRLASSLYGVMTESINMETRVLESPVLFSETYGPDKEVKIQYDHVLVVMPQSHGDILLLTASLEPLKQRFKEVHVATKPQYFELLEGCPSVTKLIPYNVMHESYNLMHRYYGAVYTPHFETQRNANWVHGGMFTLSLAEVYARHCNVKLGNYWTPLKPYDITFSSFITLHVGSGKGEQTARLYKHWETVVKVLNSRFITVVQVGTLDDVHIPGVYDLRGKTSMAELADVVKKATLHLGIDSYPMHLAAVLNKPSVILWGNTFPHATGPEPRLRKNMTALEPGIRDSRCPRACHTVACPHCLEALNSIDPQFVANEVLRRLNP